MNLKGKQSEKQQLLQILDDVYRQSKNEQAFFENIRKQGIQLYFRGKQAGVISKRKYRLKTLGYSNERIQLLNLSKRKREQELERMISSRLSGREQNQEHEQ